jgi:hypothetical protein
MSSFDAEWIGANFAEGHLYQKRREAFLSRFTDDDIEFAVIDAIGLEYLDEAVSRAMYALGYDGDFEFDGLDEEDMTEEQIARYRRWY